MRSRRKQKISPNTAQDYLKACQLSHKGERNKYGLDTKKASEIGFNMGFKPSYSTYKEMNLISCMPRIN
jgi:hypothetical protein